jgi:hypothetical protein
MECVWTITRRDIEPHLLGPASSLNLPLTVPKASVASSSSSDEDDDEDLEAEFEAEFLE